MMQKFGNGKKDIEKAQEKDVSQILGLSKQI